GRRADKSVLFTDVHGKCGNRSGRPRRVSAEACALLRSAPRTSGSYPNGRVRALLGFRLQAPRASVRQRRHISRKNNMPRLVRLSRRRWGATPHRPAPIGLTRRGWGDPSCRRRPGGGGAGVRGVVEVGDWKGGGGMEIDL